MRKFSFSDIRPRGMVLSFLSLAILILFAGGCASLKCGKKDPAPSSPPPTPCPADPASDDCGGSCPAAPVSHSPATVSVSGSEPAPDGSVVSGEEIPQTVSQDAQPAPPAPPITSGSAAGQYLNEQQGEIIRNPNSGSSDSGISPAGYQGSAPAPIRENEIPSGYSGLTQTAQNQGVFQNVSQPSRSRVQFRTVIEEE